MFVRLVNKKNDHVSIRIVENKRENGKVKQKTVCCVGHFHKDKTKEIETHTRFAEELIVKIKNENKPSLPGLEEATHSAVSRINNDDRVHVRALKEVARTDRGIQDIFGTTYDQLDLNDCIQTGYKKEETNDLLKEIVLSRLSSPASKSKSVENIEKDKNRQLDLDRVYRMMDKVFSDEERIKKKLFDSTLSLLKQKVDVAFFDVTTLYFESFQPDELRSFGFSKDCKFKETQVMLALITTTEGLPISYELFPGNTYEGSTLIGVIEKVEKNYDISNTFIVADRAMFTKENLQHMDSKGVKFIVAAKLKGMRKAVKEEILKDVEQALAQDKELNFWAKDYNYNGHRLVISYSKKRADKDRKERERLVERINKKMKDGKVLLADLINNTGTKKYLKVEKGGSKVATLNNEKMEQESRWDGVHGLITNHLEADLSIEAILERYKGLWQIEAAFRVNKHDLKMRPIYHWTPKRIKAHILICFIAYGIATTVRYKLKLKDIHLSFEELRSELGSLQESLIVDTKTGKKFILPSKITNTQRQIYKAFNLNLFEEAKIIKM